MVDNVKSEAIQHGFHACGLYPWNPPAIDYTKCTGKNKDTNPDKAQKIETDAITFKTFRKIVGEKKMEMFNNFNENNLHSEDFLALYNL